MPGFRIQKFVGNIFHATLYISSLADGHRRNKFRTFVIQQLSIGYIWRHQNYCRNNFSDNATEQWLSLNGIN